MAEQTSTAASVIPDFIQAWADENTRMEGWIPAGTNPAVPRGSLSWRHLNPGNLVAHGKYRVFATYADGRLALCEDLLAKCHEHPTWTVQQAMNEYCPEPDGNPLNRGNKPNVYAVAVAKAMGVTPQTQLCNVGMLWDKNGRVYAPAVFAH